MSLLNLAHEELHGLVAQLEQSLYNHQQWHNALIRTLICRLPADQHDINAKAHRSCRFGQWYYQLAPNSLQTHPGFIALGKEHQHMHKLAAKLLVMNETSTISPHDYDNFANVLERMRLETFTLKRELEDLLYNSDPLTRTINRVNMLPILREQHTLVTRNAQTCCIVMMDLDHFKKFNDDYGHLVGDKVLAAFAQYIIEHLRPYDKVFRYGGEEFLICMQHTELSNAFDIVERLRTGLEKNQIKQENGKTLSITASFGLTQLDPTVPVEQSIDRADKAMYLAKNEGRNRTIIWQQNG
ncbi:MAG: diguanylate cyclase [Gammaproteobacteria bacterium]|nr:diguanylate cyclase [Gammaproteobacteria bacterium]